MPNITDLGRERRVMPERIQYQAPPRRPRRLFFVALTALGLLGLYAALGFLAVPRLVRSRVVEAGPELGLQIGLGKVSANPFSLALTLRDFTLADRSGERVAAFDTLHINFQSSSLFRRAWTFAELRIVTPRVRALVREDGSVNLQDLVPPADSQAPATPKRGPVPVIIHRLNVRDGQVAFEDRQRTTPFTTTIDPIDLALRDFTTRPDETGTYQFEAETSKGEQLRWRGTFSTVPLRSAGTLSLAGIQARSIWEYLRDQVWYEITGGRGGFQASYALDFSASPGAFTITGGSGRIDSLRLRDTRDSAEAVVLERLELGGVDASVFERSYRIGSITAQGGRLAGIRLPDSTFTLQTLFLPRPDPRAPPDTAGPWTGTIDRVEASELSLHVEDRTLTPPAAYDVAPLAVTLEHYPQGVPGDAGLDLQFGINGAGSARLTGSYTPEPAAANLTIAIEGLPLAPFEPYVQRTARLGIPSGTLGVAGQVNWLLREQVPSVRFTGDLSILGFRAVDQVRREDFTRWARLDLKRVRYDTDPRSVAIDEIVARGAYLRAIIGPDRITNLQLIMAPPGDSLTAVSYLADDSTIVAEPRGPRGRVPAAADTLAVPEDSGGPSRPITPTRIGQIRVVDGTLNFSDLSLTPNFSVSIEQLNGTIKGLSSAQLARADVDLSGKVDRYAPATITGQINPLSEQTYTDLAMKFTGIELTTFTPYSGKFAGYKIEKGKLNLDLHYRLNGRYLVAENRIVFDQLTLGEKVQSPDATSLPVKLAVALLKDGNGVIDLDIPVKGDVSDPKFSVMPIILKALVNLLVKAVTSPFKLLGALFGGGGGDDLEYVSFAAGSEVLDSTQAAKLDSLAVALVNRPELRLDIRGSAALSADQDSLATRGVLRQLFPGDSTPGPATKTERNRIALLYRDRFQEEAGLLVPETDSAGRKLPTATRDSLLTAAALARLVGAYEVPPDALRELARRRGAAVQQRLLAAQGADPSRVFLLDVDTEASAQEGRVRVTLKLDSK